MKSPGKIYNLFNIRPEEVPVFLRLVIFTIFNGLGIALSFTAINVLVIEQHGIATLPYIYVLSSLLLFVGGFIYSGQENTQPPLKLLTAVMLLAVIWAFSVRGLLGSGNTVLVIGFAFCSYYLVQLLTNLAFSTAAFILFDVRQGKRLFGPLAVGESFAQLLGYTLVPVILHWFNIEDALYLAGSSFAVSWFLLYSLIRKNPEKFEVNRKVESDDRLRLNTLNIKNLIGLFRTDAFARSVSILSILAAALYFTLHYAFLDRMESQFENLKDIALYFSVCLIIANVFNILIKLFISSRVLARFGVRAVLLVLPFILIVINAFGLLGMLFGIHDTTFFIWIFGISFLADEALRSSLYIPTYMTLFQPMARNRRRVSHTMSKGIMEPLGIGIAGLVIIGLKAINIFDLEVLTICILVFAGLWFLWSFKVIHAYLRLLYDALKFRILNKKSEELSRDEIDRLKNKLKYNEDHYELLYIAKILQGRLNPGEQSNLVKSLLKSDDKSILANAIDYILENHLEEYAPQLRSFMDGDDDRIAEKATYALAALKEEDFVDQFRNYKSKTTAREDALIGATLKYGGLHGAVRSGQKFLKKINSKSESDRIRAAHILGQIANPQYYHPLIGLLAEDNIDVQKAAIKTVGKLKLSKLLPQLIEKVDTPRLFPVIAKAVTSMKESVMPVIRSMATSASSTTLKKYMVLASKVGGSDATTFLISGLHSEEHAIRSAGINGLHKLKYRATGNHVEIINTAIDNIIEMIHRLNVTTQHSELNSAIQNELTNILRPQLLQLLGTIYGHKVINKVSENLNIDEGDYKSNALELLENTISNNHSKRIIPLFESDFLKGESKTVESAIGGVINEIFKSPKPFISDWLKAISIRVSRDLKILETDHWIQKVRPIQSRILEQEIELYIQQTS